MSCSISGTVSSIAGIHALPVDSSLGVATTPTVSLSTTLASTPISLADTLIVHPVVDHPKPPTVVVTEGIPPVPCWLVDRARKWEYVNLADLLGDHSPDHLTIINGQVIAVTSAGTPKRSRTITDILTWLQAFSILSAILVSSEDTTKEEAAGLAAHSYLIIQLSRDLSGSQWLKYDQQFREWAVAKGIRRWGELNLTIYGRCLAAHLSDGSMQSAVPKQKQRSSSNACYRWNDGITCNSSTCRTLHPLLLHLWRDTSGKRLPPGSLSALRH